MATSTPPACSTPKWASKSGSELRARNATRSSFANPAARRAWARRRERPRHSPNVYRRPPSTTAMRPACTVPARSRNETGVSSSRYTRGRDSLVKVATSVDPARTAGPFALAEHVLLDLARRRSGQLAEIDQARRLEVRQAVAHVLDDLVRRGAGARPERHERLGDLAPRL